MNADGTVVIRTDLSSDLIDKQIEALTDKLEGLEEEFDILQKSKAFEGQTEELIKLGKEIDTTRKRLQKLVQQKENMNKSGFEKVQESIENVGKSTQKAIKNVSKWALAVFGLRSAYMFVRNAINTIASNDEQLTADIDYIKNVLAYAIEPIIRTIVNFAKQLVTYVGYIIKAWTGRDIFKSYANSLKSANKSANELKKTFAGFDKFNTLNASGTVTGGVGTTLPSMEQGDIPGWVEWIASNGETVLEIMSGLAGAILAVKLGLESIKALGIGIAIAGIVTTIQELLDYLNDPSWENFGGILEGIGLTVLGLGIIFGSLPVAVAGAIALILGIIATFWDDIKEFLNNFTQNIYKAGDDIMNFLYNKFGIFGLLLGTIVQTAVGIVTSAINSVLEMFSGLFTGVKDILDGIIMIFQGDFGGGLLRIGKGIINALIGMLNGLIEGMNMVLAPMRAIIVAAGAITGAGWTMDNIKIPTIPKLAVGGIINFPGKGVMLPGAIGGEKSREGVLPLTDEAVMSQLGQEIGRHVHVNADITLEIERRVLARVLKEINQDSLFLRNGG